MQRIETMRVLVSGSTGLIGSALAASLERAGHEVVRLVRAKRGAGDSGIVWDPAGGVLDGGALKGFHGIVHLAGENIAGGRWTAARKAAILDSRVKSTRLLAEAAASLDYPPACLVCASAVGYYGDRGDELLTEESAPGAGFLAEVCTAWEAAAQLLRDKGARVVNLRFGMVLSATGGALKRLLPAFKLGMGGALGTGRQYVSWITLEDAVAAIRHALTTPTLCGPVNAVAPEQVTNREFTKTLARVLSRPALLPAPAVALRFLLGEMADELLLASARALPGRLIESGFEFRHPNLEAAFRVLLERQRSPECDQV